eukprot:4959265-Amphidinium_carterae.1
MQSQFAMHGTCYVLSGLFDARHVSVCKRPSIAQLVVVPDPTRNPTPRRTPEQVRIEKLKSARLDKTVQTCAIASTANVRGWEFVVASSYFDTNCCSHAMSLQF